MSTTPKGGAREGAGRKSRHDEKANIKLSLSAIEKHYGSLEKGFMKLLNSDEPSLVKFVWEHAIGKPKENVNLNGNVVFRLRKPGESLIEEGE